MRDRWGSDDHGPGGDPSWLGGADRGGAEQHGADGSGGWSSDFAADAQGADSDFGGSSDPLAAERMAPRFGEVTGDAARSPGGEPESPWLTGFAGLDTEDAENIQSSLRRAVRGIVPVLLVVVFGVIVMKLFDFGFIGMWLFVFLIPFLGRIFRTIRKRLGD
ncbi:hypothetical protein CFK39_09315 [Brachybacterium avium]|uniref:Uncharacterized protein n=1 Tax=Brachybacterium avium TaxID=2017485 RepID=A0A220UCX6_9MICO|nr:hypothetical protein [Brachybacterium avium]ASK65987.1 hypothetical protein CFK39_09315 [Brachybacterium avium]